MKGVDSSGKITLTAHATTNCDGEPVELDAITVDVDSPPPDIKVSELDMQATLPNGQSYLPATKPGSALIMISAATAGAGAVVSLTASGGTVVPTQVTLAGDGMGKASAMALLSSNPPGIAAVAASSMGQTKLITVPVVGPPVVAPSGGVLALGLSINLTASAAKLESCQASPSLGLTVTAGGQDLMAMPVTGDRSITISVAAAQTLTSPAQTTITCRDPFGQTGTATFSAAPPP